MVSKGQFVGLDCREPHHAATQPSNDRHTRFNLVHKLMSRLIPYNHAD